jgi:hypothetical protein
VKDTVLFHLIGRNCLKYSKPSLIRIDCGEIIRTNIAKDSHKRQKLTKQINKKCNNIGSADENKEKISLQQFVPLSETEIQDLLHPAQFNFGYFLAWFQSLQLPSTQSESPLALIPLVPKSHVSFKVCTQL